MSTPLVKINNDPAERIAILHGVGDVLARRIVEYRNRNGFFRSPEDLDKVEGVSIKLAETLSPHIDWSIPEAQHSEPPNRDWSSSVFYIAAMLMLIALAVSDWPRLYETFRLSWKLIRPSYLLRDYSLIFSEIIDLTVETAVMFIQLMAAIGFGLEAVRLVVKTPKTHRRISYLLKGSILGVLLGILTLGVSNFFQRRLYTLSAWASLFRQGWPFLGLIGGITILTFFSPFIIKVFRPSITLKDSFHRLYDRVTLTLSFTLSLSIFIVGIYNPPLERLGFQPPQIFILLLGFLISLASGYFLVIGISPSQVIVKFLSATKSADEKSEEEMLRWLNTHLPDIGHQQTLKKALDKTYRRGRARTAASIFIIGVGGWVLLQFISALIQWATAKWLDNFIPK